MAKAVTDRQPVAAGLVVTRYGHALGPGELPAHIELIEAGHPVPDAAGLRAAERAMALVANLDEDDRLLALISGGGSSLLPSLPAGMTLSDEQQVTRALLSSGAAIDEINAVRRCLSRIKGGRLAALASPAEVVTLVLSDVPGDDPALVASGPTVAGKGGLAEAREVLQRYGIAVPGAVAVALEDPANAPPSIEDLGDARVTIVGSGQTALAAAAALAEARGLRAVVLGDRLSGEARDLGLQHASLARNTTGGTVLLSGGETTVTVTNAAGRGGRNLEYLLGLGLALDGDPRVHALACDTDGIDGTQDCAGAILRPDTLARASRLGLDPEACLANNDAWTFFDALGDTIVTGPTRTNVNDFRAVLIGSA